MSRAQAARKDCNLEQARQRLVDARQFLEAAELLEAGGWHQARDIGKLRVEGKEYVVDDGDVMEFRFNV